MSREKIEEMAKIAQDAIDYYSSGDCPYSPCRYRDSSICCDVCASIKALCDAGYRKQEWISVDERLPEDKQMCLAYATVYFVPDHVDECDHSEEIIVTKFYKDFGFMDWHVHFWMPLPEAPKMKGGAE